MRGLCTSHKHLCRLITKSEINLVALAEPFFKEKSIHGYSQLFKFYNFALMSQWGELWVLWQDEHPFIVVTIFDPKITGWMAINGVKTFISFMYDHCRLHECKRL